MLNLNFGVQVDHYIQIDFCAFRRLVQAVGGVEIPFQYPARDKPSNGNPPLFLVEQTGCVNLDGDTALAYVRSRHYQYEDPPGSGHWVSDPTSDFGRITRQQDFLRRVLAKVIDDGLYDPDVASALITANRKYIVTDPDLTLRRMLEFANALKNFDPAAVTTYRIDSTPHTTSDGATGRDPPDQRRQHAGDPGRVPRRGHAGERPGAGVRGDHDDRPRRRRRPTTTAARRGGGTPPPTPPPTPRCPWSRRRRTTSESPPTGPSHVTDPGRGGYRVAARTGPSERRRAAARPATVDPAPAPGPQAGDP